MCRGRISAHARRPAALRRAQLPGEIRNTHICILDQPCPKADMSAHGVMCTVYTGPTRGLSAFASSKWCWEIVSDKSKYAINHTTDDSTLADHGGGRPSLLCHSVASRVIFTCPCVSVCMRMCTRPLPDCVSLACCQAGSAGARTAWPSCRKRRTASPPHLCDRYVEPVSPFQCFLCHEVRIGLPPC